MQKRPYIDPTSAAAEALGPKPPAESPAAWQQASNRPRPKPGRVAPRPVVKSSHGYFKAHWLGEHSLPRSYWLNNFLVATPLAMALTGLMSWISVKGDSLQISAIVVLIGFPLLIALNVWCLVGAWRSARNYLQERGSALWGWLARISLVLGTAQLAASVLFGFLPSLAFAPKDKPADAVLATELVEELHDAERAEHRQCGFAQERIVGRAIVTPCAVKAGNRPDTVGRIGRLGVRYDVMNRVSGLKRDASREEFLRRNYRESSMAVGLRGL